MLFRSQVSIDYQDETDFVRKMRAASLLTPFFALLSDNAPVYQASRNSSYCIRTRLWQDVDRDRCGVTPHLMDADFGYARYAENVLTKPQNHCAAAGPRQGCGRKDCAGALRRARQPSGNRADFVQFLLRCAAQIPH